MTCPASAPILSTHSQSMAGAICEISDAEKGVFKVGSLYELLPTSPAKPQDMDPTKAPSWGPHVYSYCKEPPVHPELALILMLPIRTIHEPYLEQPKPTIDQLQTTIFLAPPGQGSAPAARVRAACRSGACCRVSKYLPRASTSSARTEG